MISVLYLCSRGENGRGENLLVLGIARGYHEAAEVTGRMVDDMYHQTGGFDWKAYMDQMAGK